MGIAVRFETLDGMVRWREVSDLEHGTLCRAGGLNEAITWYDIPRSMLDGSHRSGREISGTIHQGPRDAPPIGKITIAHEGERFADEDHREMVKRLGWRAA